jgi:protein phosphatase PTC2/3
MQGFRCDMEDSHAAVLDLRGPDGQKCGKEGKVSFFGVYDGHSGNMVSKFSGAHLHKIVAKQQAFMASKYVQALKDGFMATDEAILKGDSSKSEMILILIFL